MRRSASQNVYEIRPRNDKRGVDLISDALPKKPCGSGGGRNIDLPPAIVFRRSRSTWALADARLVAVPTARMAMAPAASSK